MLASNQARLLSVTPTVQPAARLSDYIAIARPDHWIKHVLIVPGAVFAAIMSPAGSIDYASLGSRLIVCLIVAMALSSANYTINEWLETEFIMRVLSQWITPMGGRRVIGVAVCVAGGAGLAARLTPVAEAVADTDGDGAVEGLAAVEV